MCVLCHSPSAATSPEPREAGDGDDIWGHWECVGSCGSPVHEGCVWVCVCDGRRGEDGDGWGHDGTVVGLWVGMGREGGEIGVLGWMRGMSVDEARIRGGHCRGWWRVYQKRIDDDDDDGNGMKQRERGCVGWWGWWMVGTDPPSPTECIGEVIVCVGTAGY